MLDEEQLRGQEITVRPIEVSDAGRVAALSGELGYPTSLEDMVTRMERAKLDAERLVFVASVSNEVVGWIDVGVVRHLTSEPQGEIFGLIVSGEHRGQGIGKALLQAAEQWVGTRGIPSVTVRSRIARERAHRFYLREGYEHVKTSAVFRKTVTP